MATATKHVTLRDPLDVSACTLANVRQASRAISQVYGAALQPADIKATQFTVLAALSKNDQLPLSQLAEIMVMDRTTLTRNLQPLVKRQAGLYCPRREPARSQCASDFSGQATFRNRVTAMAQGPIAAGRRSWP